MGKSNIAVKQWLRNKKRFADLFNGTIFQGEQIVLPEELEEIDSESSIIVTDKNHKEKGVQKYRDIAMRWKDDIQLSILACENQNKVHYAMPVRMMLYDSLTYTDQIRQMWVNHESDIVVTEEEFLSKFRKEDKIYPVISLVFYYGLTPWDASVDLHEMFEKSNLGEKSQILKKYVPNYRLNLIDAGNIENIQKFQSDLQLIFGMLRYKEKKDELHRYMNANGAYFKNVNQETYQAIRELLHSEKELKGIISDGKRKGNVNMCKALEDLYNSGVNLGMEKGMEKGAEAKLLEQIEKKLMKGKSVEKIAEELEENIDRICNLMALL